MKLDTNPHSYGKTLPPPFMRGQLFIAYGLLGLWLMGWLLWLDWRGRLVPKGITLDYTLMWCLLPIMVGLIGIGTYLWLLNDRWERAHWPERF